MTPATLLPVFEVVMAAAAAATSYRLWRSGLRQRYPLLFVYMLFLVPYSLYPEVLDRHSVTYFFTWLSLQPLLWILEILMVRELCRVVLERHPGLVTLGRWMMYVGVAVAGFLSFLSLLPHIQSTMSVRSKILGYWVAGNRGVSLSLVVFLFLMLFAVSRYPVKLSRNVILNATLFTLCFTADSLGAILKAMFDLSLSPSVIATLSGIQVLCLIGWLFWLSPKGEHTHFAWLHFGPEYEERVLGQLDALNRILQGNA
jgi:hypothetical protein